jgi:hypothetical protein
MMPQSSRAFVTLQEPHFVDDAQTRAQSNWPGQQLIDRVPDTFTVPQECEASRRCENETYRDDSQETERQKVARPVKITSTDSHDCGEGPSLLHEIPPPTTARKPWETLIIGDLGENLSLIEEKNREIEQQRHILEYHKENSPDLVEHHENLFEGLISERQSLADNEENNLPA